MRNGPNIFCCKCMIYLYFNTHRDKFCYEVWIIQKHIYISLFLCARWCEWLKSGVRQLQTCWHFSSGPYSVRRKADGQGSGRPTGRPIGLPQVCYSFPYKGLLYTRTTDYFGWHVRHNILRQRKCMKNVASLQFLWFGRDIGKYPDLQKRQPAVEFKNATFIFHFHDVTGVLWWFPYTAVGPGNRRISKHNSNMFW